MGWVDGVVVGQPVKVVEFQRISLYNSLKNGAC